MYICYCLIMWCFIYTLPALACMPKLVYSPRTAFAIPILSALMIYLVTSVLLALGVFTTGTVTLSALVLGGVALYRLYDLLQTKSLAWSKVDKGIYFFNLILLFPFLIKLGTHGFDRGDEIYSWNFWAIQHFYSEAIDFSHTGAPYPQLFPKLLAYSYHLIGNTELQLPVKATLIVFPWAMLTAITMTLRQVFSKYIFSYLLLLIYVLAGVGLAQFFDDGYADPIMTSALIVSAVLFWQSQQRLTASSAYLALLAVLCAWVCAHSKQAGLLWTAFSLPALLLLAYRQDKDRQYWILSALSLFGACLWMGTEGQQFHQNQGVLWLSLGNRNVFSQLLYSINQYFIHQPLLLGLLILTIWVSAKNTLLKHMVWLFLIPGWVCWFLFGAYQLRLGQHLIAFAFFVVVASHYTFPSLQTLHQYWIRFKHQCELNHKALISGVISFSVVIGSVLFIKEVYLVKGGISLYEGGRQSLHRYFGKESDTVYQQIYSDPHAVLWVPTRYIYGLFYKHTQLTTPDYGHYQHYNAEALIDELKRKLPDYVFTVSAAVIDGPASEELSKIIAKCPKSFQKVSGPKNRFNFRTYKVDKLSLQQDACLISLANADRFQSSSRLSLAAHKEGKSDGSQ